MHFSLEPSELNSALATAIIFDTLGYLEMLQN